jgi:hypothetical protein
MEHKIDNKRTTKIQFNRGRPDSPYTQHLTTETELNENGWHGIIGDEDVEPEQLLEEQLGREIEMYCLEDEREDDRTRFLFLG